MNIKTIIFASLLAFMFLLMTTLLCGCKPKVYSSEDGITERAVEVEKLFSKNDEVLGVERSEVRSGIESCSYSGLCYGCGYNLYGKSGCGFGFRSDCSGNREVQVIFVTTTYRTHYDTDKGKFVSAVHKSTEKEYVNIGSCH
jgi:hypothetical protein